MAIPESYRSQPCCRTCAYGRDSIGGVQDAACSRIEASPCSPLEVLGRNAHLIIPYLDWMERNEVEPDGICDEYEAHKRKE